jgi:hypothetical protein
MTLEERMHNDLMAARLMRPWTPGNLWDYIACYYGLGAEDKLKIPQTAVCPGHSAPFDAVVGHYFDTTDGWGDEDRARYKVHRNAIIKGPRGGGKSVIAGLLSHLDSIHRPGCGTLILGGSERQSERVYAHNKAFNRRSFMDLVKGEPLLSLTDYRNGSTIERLTQSPTSVRGPHKARVILDEIDEFGREIWETALGMAQEQPGIPAKMMLLSTMHYPGGIMQRVWDQAGKDGSFTRYDWCVFECCRPCQDECSEESPNERCVRLAKVLRDGRMMTFFDVCGCKAKRSDGYYSLDDLRDKFQQMSWDTFCSEMLCIEPKREGLIYPTFDEMFHKLAVEIDDDKDSLLIAGVDGGYDNPHAVWINILPDEGETAVFIDEYAPKLVTAPKFVEGFIAQHEARGYQRLTAMFIDPSAKDLRMQFNDEAVLNRLFRYGVQIETTPFRCYALSATNIEGYEAVRRRLDRYVDKGGNDWCGLFVSPRCQVLLQQVVALRSREVAGRFVDDQVKENDHGPDAGRYALKGWDRIGQRLRAWRAEGASNVVLIGRS